MLNSYVSWLIHWFDGPLPLSWLVFWLFVCIGSSLVLWKKGNNPHDLTDYSFNIFIAVVAALLGWIFTPIIICFAAITLGALALYCTIESGHLLRRYKIYRRTQVADKKDYEETLRRRKFENNLREVAKYDPEAYELLRREP